MFKNQTSYVICGKWLRNVRPWGQFATRTEVILRSHFVLTRSIKNASVVSKRADNKSNWNANYDYSAIATKSSS